MNAKAQQQDEKTTADREIEPDSTTAKFNSNENSVREASTDKGRNKWKTSDQTSKKSNKDGVDFVG